MPDSSKILVIGSLAESLVNFRGDLIRELKGRGHQVIAAAPAGPLWVDEALARWGLRRVELPLYRTGTNPVRDAKLLWVLVRLLRAERPDVLFAYTIKPVVYGSIAARIAGVPRVVALITGLGFSFLQARSLPQRLVQRLARGLYALALRSAHTVLFQNPDDERECRRLGLIPLSLQVGLVPGSGVHLERYAAQPLPQGPRRFLLIARLLVDKGVREYLRAAARLHALRPDIECHLVGPIESHPASIQEAEIEAAVANGAIHYHGAAQDVRPFLRDCHVYVLPSYREGTPRTVLEALATGRPIITTDAPGCRETVVPGRNGVLVPVENADALFNEMLRFADMDDAELERMAAASREIAEAKFDVHKVNAKIIAAMGLDA